MKKILLFLFLFSMITAKGQSWYKKKIFENYIFSIEAGASSVITEYKRDLSGFINEMIHSPSYTYSLSLKKLITQNLSIGYEYEYSSFNGKQDNPDFSAYHFGHYKISLMRIEPVIYISQIYNHNLIVNYLFNSRKREKIIPFVYIKAGISKLKSELKYTSNNEVIFAKVGWEEDLKNVSNFALNFNIGIGCGIEWVVDPTLRITFKTEFNNINDDNLDAVHNFKTAPPEGYKNYVNGLYGRAVVGLSYIINPNNLQSKSRRNHRAKARKSSGFRFF